MNDPDSVEAKIKALADKYPGYEVESLYRRITSPESRQAADRLFVDSTEEIAKSFHSTENSPQ